MSEPVPARHLSVSRGLVVLAAAGLVAALAAGQVTAAGRFLTKKKADKRYINVGEKASDADLLDGQDSSAFLGASETAANAALLDNLDSTDFQGAYAQTVVVSPVGTAAENGAALLAALNGITDNSASKPYLLKIEPGQYDLGSGTLQTKTFVDIEGSGRYSTVVFRGGFSDTSGATVEAAAGFSEMRFLAVINNGGAPYATAIRVTGSARLTHIGVQASGGTTESRGIYVVSGLPVLEEVVVLGVGGSATGYGIYSEGNPYMANGFIVTSGTTASYGVYVTNNEFNIDRSLIIGGTDAISENGSGGTAVRVGASRLEGGVSGDGVVCAYSYNGLYQEGNPCPS
jgi:hypothetical protein